MIGSAAGQASVREFIRQVRAGRPVTAEIGGKYWWDGMNEIQVRERANLTTDELIAEWDAALAACGERRARSCPDRSRGCRWSTSPRPSVVSRSAYLFDVGFTRDAWMHRIDLARATGRPMDVDADHDGRIVADIVAEWAGHPRRAVQAGPHGPCRRHLCPGIRCARIGRERHTLDAIEFARILAERAHGDGVLRHKLPL